MNVLTMGGLIFAAVYFVLELRDPAARVSASLALVPVIGALGWFWMDYAAAWPAP